MADLRLITTTYSDCTLGRIQVGNIFQCFTLELPWKDNKQNVSCYPAGIYSYQKRISPSKGSEVIQLIDVPNRTYIQIHAGNYTSQIEGCTLVGDSVKYLNGDSIPDVANSGNSLKQLLTLVPNTGTIEVIRYGINHQS